jgi:hypothetical protein
MADTVRNVVAVGLVIGGAYVVIKYVIPKLKDIDLSGIIPEMPSIIPDSSSIIPDSSTMPQMPTTFPPPPQPSFTPPQTPQFSMPKPMKLPRNGGLPFKSASGGKYAYDPTKSRSRPSPPRMPTSYKHKSSRSKGAMPSIPTSFGGSKKKSSRKSKSKGGFALPF